MRWAVWVPLLGLLGAGEGGARQRGARAVTLDALVPVLRGGLHVTEGFLGTAKDGRHSVDAPKVRAVLERNTPQDVALDFTYLGPTEQQLALGSGELRQQVALKLRALDGCNLLYATWRFAPKSAVVVSLKSNPGQHTSAQCGNRGYWNLKAVEGRPPPPLAPGAHHVFRARLDGERLLVSIDGVPVWSGELPEQAARLQGPVGMRTDNVRIVFSLLAPRG